MIVKVQISLQTTEDEPQVLVYNEARVFFAMLPLSACPGLEDVMDAADAGPLRCAFFEAEIVGEVSQGTSKVQLGRLLPEQGW